MVGKNLRDAVTRAHSLIVPLPAEMEPYLNRWLIRFWLLRIYLAISHGSRIIVWFPPLVSLGQFWPSSQNIIPIDIMNFFIVVCCNVWSLTVTRPTDLSLWHRAVVLHPASLPWGLLPMSCLGVRPTLLWSWKPLYS